MKFVVLLAVPSVAFAASWTSLFQNAQIEAVSPVDENGCIANAEAFMTKEFTKYKAIERAMDNCALSKKVDDNNFVCPHYREILNAAFRREPTDRLYSAESFCGVAEVYVHQLKSAAKVPNMGTGDGFKFKLSKDCKHTVLASLAPQKKMPAVSAPDFWYALCMNQDCAHFLPSRTRWCSQKHQPTHSASVCEAVRLFAHDEASVAGPAEMDAEQVCNVYDEFVEDSHINVKAYMHVVHGRATHPAPVPEDQERALASARMKHEAKAHGIRDQSGDPVKSFAAAQMPAALLIALVSFAGL